MASPAIFVVVALGRSGREASSGIVRALTASLGFCILPFVLIAVVEITRFFVHYDEGGPLVLIVFFVGPGGLLVGNIIGLGCLARTFRAGWWAWPLRVVAINGTYLALFLWLLLNVHM